MEVVRHGQFGDLFGEPLNASFIIHGFLIREQQWEVTLCTNRSSSSLAVQGVRGFQVLKQQPRSQPQPRGVKCDTRV